MNLDVQIQELYNSYIQQKRRPASDITEICLKIHEIEKVLVFGLIVEPNMISAVSKLLLNHIRENC